MLINPETLSLSNGYGSADKPCLQQKAALVHAHTHGYLTTAGLDAVLTDRPCWQNSTINVAGIAINDLMPEDGDWFQRLDKLMPRLVAATVVSDSEVEKRINARLTCWLARECLHVFEDAMPGDDRPRYAIEMSEAWLRGEASEEECHVAGARTASVPHVTCPAYNLYARDVANAAAAYAAYADHAAHATYAVDALKQEGPQRLLRLLEELCDQHDKAKAEEGVMLDDGWMTALTEAGLLVPGLLVFG